MTNALRDIQEVKATRLAMAGKYHGGVHGIAALVQHVQASLGGEGLGAGDHVAAHHR